MYRSPYSPPEINCTSKGIVSSKITVLFILIVTVPGFLTVLATWLEPGRSHIDPFIDLATVVAVAAFLDAFQKVADLATNSRGGTKDIGSALTRMCMRHRSIEAKLKQFSMAFLEGMINPLQEQMEDWKRGVNTLDKDHAKEYKRARQEIKKKSSDTLKLQKKAKKADNLVW
ncbi:metastasis suppressor protein 1-like [Notothenia coriiceps]|uniref:Metastasis suppressor protein 1-like n=1 Tax=Notothenia coriiceps TaxID=8208 RepID=A0A6I9MJ02_9TELE|nr:PREDICTED: metastasis suppressor protein 1-like [Notothenia coriiceps]